MKVLLNKNVPKLGIIGDVVDVRPGYARNYLLPQGLAVEPTEANLKAMAVKKQRYLEQLKKDREAHQAKAEAIRGKEITISARATEQGHLYGSIGPAQIAEALAAEDIFVEPSDIVLDQPIRRLDKYDVTIRFAKDVTTEIHVWVVPARDEDKDSQMPAPPDAGGADGAGQ